jgi:hypothetical protein
MKNDMGDVKARLASIESYISTLHTDQTRTSTKLADIIKREESETEGWLEGLGLIDRKPRGPENST